MSNQTLGAFVSKVTTIVQQDERHRYIVHVDGSASETSSDEIVAHNGFRARLQKMTENGLENVREVKPFYYISSLSGHDWRAKRDLLINVLKDRGVLIAT